MGISILLFLLNIENKKPGGAFASSGFYIFLVLSGGVLSFPAECVKILLDIAIIVSEAFGRGSWYQNTFLRLLLLKSAFILFFYIFH